jgi:hypothetical protein
MPTAALTPAVGNHEPLNGPRDVIGSGFHD